MYLVLMLEIKATKMSQDEMYELYGNEQPGPDEISHPEPGRDPDSCPGPSARTEDEE